MPRFHLGLGSNVGDRAAHLEHAVRALAGHGTVLARAPWIETEPVDCPAGGPFLNSCLCLETGLPPGDLLAVAMRIERARGRRRGIRNEPRILDIDLLLAGSRIIDEPGLAIPHPRMCERRFVLEPLAAIAPRLVHPGRLLTVRELLGRLRAGAATR